MNTKAKLEMLFDRAVSNLSKSTITSSLAKGKAFELYALLKILKRLKRQNYNINAINPPKTKANELRFAGGPANADKSQYTYFEITHPITGLKFEGWVSVEVRTLSAKIGNANLSLPAGYHELDIAIFKPLKSMPYKPSKDELIFAASCKDSAFTKQHLREALGLKRETALYTKNPNPLTLADWFIDEVPSKPAIPLVLFSRDIKCQDYKEPVNLIGVYVRHLKFP